MSEITRTEKFLRACIDGEPCALKPLTRVEKLLAELNDKLAGGPSEVVILPETELVYTSDGYILPVPLENAPTGGGNYKIVWDGVEYISPALDVTETLGEGDLSLAFGDSTILMGEEGAAAVGNPLPGAPFFMMLFPNGTVYEEGAPTLYGVFKATAEPTNPTLSIVQVGAASGGTVEVDATLTKANTAADAKVVGDQFTSLYEENASLSSKLNSITVVKPSSEMVNVEFEELPSYVISGGGKLNAMSTYQPNYCVSALIDVTPGETLSITASAGYTSAVYVFYDASENAVDALKSPSDGTYVDLVDEAVIVPENATLLRIAYNSNRRIGSVKRFAPSEEVVLRKWHGKKWCVIGDSLTEYNHRTTKNYHDYVRDATGITVVNLGASGTGYAKGADDNRAFLNRIANIPVDSDVVTIFGSGNDMSAGLELGTPTDTGTETLCGCINTTIDNLIAIMPAVSLGIVSPTPWVGSPPSNADSGMAKYCAAMKTICENRSIPFLDLYHCSNLRPWTEEGRAACYTKDDGNGVHPDEKGHALIAPRFKAFLETLIL